MKFCHRFVLTFPLAALTATAAAPVILTTAAAGAQTVLGATRQPAQRTVTPDQAFLRSMVDHYEMIRTAAHEAMMMPAAHADHGKKADPTELDSQFDMQQRELLSLLTSLYQDSYSAQPMKGTTPAVKMTNAGMSGMTMANGTTMGATPAQIVAMLRDGVSVIDSYRGKLRHPEIRAIAARHRATLTAMIAANTAEATTPDSSGK